MRRLSPCALLLASGLMISCGTEGVIYTPANQILPQHIKRLAIAPIQNKTQQFGLEDKLALRVRDEFLRNGTYPLSPLGESDGVVQIVLTRYILTPTQYDAVLAPTAYKLRVLADLQFIDRKANVILWTESNLEGIQNYAAPTVSGGIQEEQARELIWDVLARDVVKRTVEGFGTVSGASKRDISGEAPPGPKSTEPKPKPVNPNPY